MPTTCASRIEAVIAALLVAGSIGFAVQPLAAQSLAEVAKKEQERRQAMPPPAKVYTNKDLKPVPEGSAPRADASTQPVDAAKDADKTAKDGTDKDATEKGPVKDRAYWSGKLKGLQDQLVRQQDFLDAMQTRINVLTADFVNRDDPAQRAVIERDRQKAIVELARLTKDVQDTKKAIDDLEEDARRAGVPPGWLR